MANILKDLEKTDEALVLYDHIINNSDQNNLVIKANLNKLALLIEQKQYNKTGQLLKNINSQIKLLSANRENIYSQINFVQSLLRLSAKTGKNYNNDIINILSNLLVQGEKIMDNNSLSYGYGMLGKLYLQQNQ